MTNSPHFGVMVPQIKRSWAETQRAATAFEEMGFDSLWVNDHLYGPQSPAIPMLEAWTLAAGIAAVTESAQIGTLVTPVGDAQPGAHGQDDRDGGQHRGRAGDPRLRLGLDAARVHRLRDALPGRARAARPARRGAANLPPDVGSGSGRGHVRRRVLPHRPAGHRAQAAARAADPGRRRRREGDDADRRAVRRHLEQLGGRAGQSGAQGLGAARPRRAGWGATRRKSAFRSSAWSRSPRAKRRWARWSSARRKSSAATWATRPARWR